MIGAIIAKMQIRKAFEDLNTGNIDSFLSAWTPEAVFHYPGNANASGIFSGKTTIKAWFTRMMEQYPEIDFNVKKVCVQNIFDFVGTNYVIAEWDISVKRTDGKVFKNTGITAVNLRFGKATEVRDFIFDLDTVKEAWSLAPSELVVQGL